MEEFGIDTEASQLPCKHFFHTDCIVPWLNRSNTCPLCRHKLPQEDEDQIEKELQVTLNGEVGEDNGDLGESDLAEMRDEDGDIMMVDA